jgi:hypothetical protein
MKLISNPNLVARRVFVSILAASALAVALPQSGFAAQADPLIGTWKLNVAKSTYSPGPAPRSVTATITASGQGSMAVLEGTDAAGMPIPRQVYTVVYDGQPHPVTGVPAYDANSVTRVNAYTYDFTRTKAGRVVQTGRSVFSTDGRTATFVTTGEDANGQPISNAVVFEKQ